MLEVKSGLLNLLIKTIQVKFIFVDSVFSTYSELVETIVINDCQQGHQELQGLQLGHLTSARHEDNALQAS
jgi:hypothetical protein